MTRPRFRHRGKSSDRALVVPTASLLPLWSLAGGWDREDDDEPEQTFTLPLSA